jgi:hypothetical protein
LENDPVVLQIENELFIDHPENIQLHARKL